MPTLVNPALMQLECTYDDLELLARIVCGDLAPREASQALTTGGLVTESGPDPVAAALVEVAVAPARSVSLDRFDGTQVSTMVVGWEPGGRATITTATERATLLVEASELSMVRDRARSFLRLLDREIDRSVSPLTCDPRSIDDLLSGGEESTAGDAALREILRHYRLAWRAHANWAEQAIDDSITVLDCGSLGWFLVTDLQAGQVGRLRLEQVTRTTVLRRLGDVVTGRKVDQ